MDDLVSEMVKDDSRQRPMMDTVMKRFTDIIVQLDGSILGSCDVTVNNPREPHDPLKSSKYWLRFLNLLHLLRYLWKIELS
ncbi:hypothetical protein BDQ17DRAFT_628670 [Cyathus striatus]|nr:hypothetical protein BDQ17DRAFT_628670 [Cyathus striatus]